MELRDKIKILYGMLVLIDVETRELLAFAILRYIAGWGEMSFDDQVLADSFEEIKGFLGDFE